MSCWCPQTVWWNDSGCWCMSEQSWWRRELLPLPEMWCVHLILFPVSSLIWNSTAYCNPWLWFVSLSLNVSHPQWMLNLHELEEQLAHKNYFSLYVQACVHEGIQISSVLHCTSDHIFLCWLLDVHTGSCYSVHLFNKHSCLENSMRQHCSICYEVYHNAIILLTSIYLRKL